MNQKLISKSNCVLRKVVNAKNNLCILQDLIEAFLDISIKEIQINPYVTQKAQYLPPEEDFGIADLRIITNQEEELNIGIQFIDGMYIQTKLFLYYMQIHTNQIAYSDQRKIARTITINFLNFNYFSSFLYHKKIKIQGKDEWKEEVIEFHVLEFPKFVCETKETYTKQEQWMIFLKGENQKLIEKVKQENQKIKQLDQLLDQYWEQEKI